MAKPLRKSVLLQTSSNSDVQDSGGNILITGLNSVSKKDIFSIQQLKSRAEVVQVVTVGGTAYTPTANTPYKVAIFDPLRRTAAYQEQIKTYAFSLGVITGVAATDREAIHVGLCAAINADQNNRAVATTLGGGTGFTVADDLGYYPVRSQTMTNQLGQNEVFTQTNPDGSGFVGTGTSTIGNAVVTTAAVFSQGIGAKLLQQKVVTDLVFGGNLIQGDLDDQALTTSGATAISGQNYDTFVIGALLRENIPTVSDVWAYIEQYQTVYVDNGSGAVTANLAGFLTFEREMRKHISQLFTSDVNSTIQWFDQDFVEQGLLGAAPATTAGVANKFLTPYGMLNHFNIGTQTIVTATQANAGLLIEQDVTATEGAAYTPALWTNNSQQFIVGKTPITVSCKASFTAPANIVFQVGLRSKEAHQAGFATYTKLALIGTGAAGTAVATYGALLTASTITTTSAVNLLTTVINDFRIVVDINGVVTAYANNVAFPIYSVGTTPLVFAAGTVLIPHMQYTNLNSVAAVPTVSEFWGVASDNIIVI
jgi:hypothetical protein